MNSAQIIIFLLLFSFNLKSQDITGLVYISKEADEPPTRDGRPTYKIVFKPDEKGNFIANNFKKDRKNIKVREITISNTKLKSAINQKLSDKRAFPINEFIIDLDELNKSIEDHDFVLIKSISDSLILKIDSFNYCNQFVSLKSFLIGGYNNYIYATFASGDTLTLFDFDLGDLGLREFQFRDYLISYQLIGNIIPIEFPFSEYFHEEKFREVVLYYLQTIECEDFWYNEFIKENPNRTPRENRMKVDWDFRKYINSRK